MFNPDHIKRNFPVFTQKPELVFVDNASTTQKPQVLLDAVQNAYLNYSSNYHRTLYDIGIKVDQAISESKNRILSFYNLPKENYEVLFSAGTTDGFNKLAGTLRKKIQSGQNIVVSEMEHHSNFLPWMELAKEKSAELRIIPMLDDGNLDLEAAGKMIDDNTFLVSLVHISNTLGIKNQLEEIGKIAREASAFFFIDAAQSAVLYYDEFKNIRADAYLFSTHKMFGPTGLGIILMNSQLANSLAPFSYGGGMVNEVNSRSADYKANASKHIAGTPPIAQIISFNEVMKYLEKLSIPYLKTHILEMEKKLVAGLRASGAKFLISSDNYHGILSFNFPGIHPHDASDFLNDFNIAVRAGHHCTQLIMKKFRISSSIRISLSIYNNMSDVEKILLVIPKLINAYQ